MAQFLDILSFVSVVLRGLTLVFEALTVGGVIFLFAILRGEPGKNGLVRKLCWSASALAVVQGVFVSANGAMVIGTVGLNIGQTIGASFCIAGGLMIAGAVGVVAFAGSETATHYLPVACLPILAGIVMTSHSAARLEERGALVVLTLLHHLASAAWIGGLPYLLWSLKREDSSNGALRIASRFSHMAMVSVPVLLGAGAGMGWLYIGSASALTGTSYAAMLGSKLVLTGAILLLGALNFRIVRAVRSGWHTELPVLRRFGEAEIGIGFTVILAAASLTSSPPAIDVPQADRVKPSEIVERMKPALPRMETPALRDLSPATKPAVAPQLASEPNKLADIAWSEYNHHWAGAIVLAAGVLSLLARRFQWARHWPLVFVALAAFLFLRADAENWPLGPRGFWESFRVAEVTQHRIFVLLIVAFGLFEWAVRNGRLSAQRAGLVFPLVCALGGALLLTHSHNLTNVKEEFLAELSHLPLAILGVVAGWSRWLELRVPNGAARWAQWVWPVCFTLIGLVLLDYREG